MHLLAHSARANPDLKVSYTENHASSNFSLQKGIASTSCEGPTHKNLSPVLVGFLSEKMWESRKSWKPTCCYETASMDMEIALIRSLRPLMELTTKRHLEAILGTLEHISG